MPTSALEVPDVSLSGSLSGEVPLEQVGHLLIRGFGHGGADLSLLDVAGDAGRAHHAGDALVVDPLTGRRTVVELGGDPRRPAGLVLVVDGSDPFSQRRIGSSSFGPGGGPGLPGIERLARHLDELAQSLHRVGGGVVGDELEATHQRVSPAKYLAARWRISRSVVNFVVSTSSSCTLASSRATFCSGASSTASAGTLEVGDLDCSGLEVSVPSGAVFLPVPYASSQWRSVPRTMPRSSAMPRTVAPGVDSYKSTA